MRTAPMVVTAVLGLLLAGPAAADPPYARGYRGYSTQDGYRDYARVTRVEPLVRLERVAEPVEECWDQPVHYREPGYASHGGSATPAIVGGILGAVVGSQFGKGSGKDAATIAGAVLGASIGADAGRRDRRYYGGRAQLAYERQCRVVHDYREREVHDGYRVTYVYQGRTFVTELPYDPGSTLAVDVAVRPEY